MELFEEVGQTLSRAGQGLAQKARDTAQVTKLKLAVSEDERAIEGIYLSIGKAYCRMCEACSPEQLPSEAASEPDRVPADKPSGAEAAAARQAADHPRHSAGHDLPQVRRFVQRGRQLLHQLRRKSAGGKGRCVHLPGLRQQAQARRGLLYAVRQARPVISEKEKDKGY